VGEAEGGAEVFAKIEPVLLGNGQEDIDHDGVELRAGAAANLGTSIRLA